MTTGTTPPSCNSLLRHWSRSSRASCIHDPGPVTSGGCRVVSRWMSGGRLDSLCISVTSGVLPAPGMVWRASSMLMPHLGVLGAQGAPVDVAGGLDVLAELARERPHGVLHVHGRLVLGRLGRDLVQRADRRRPFERGHDPAPGLVLQPVEISCPRLAGRHAATRSASRAHAAPSRTAVTVTAR